MFDFTQAMERLVRHISANCRELTHLCPDRLIISYIQTRSPGAHGIHASLQPLRFEGGEATTIRRGQTYTMPQVIRDGKEILYIVYFALPRFMNLSFDEKLTTVFHELYHISPEFDGDIRRFPGRKYAHGHSRKRFNERMRALAEHYLSIPESEEHTAFLRCTFEELARKHGGVVGDRVRPPRPKLIGIHK